MKSKAKNNYVDNAKLYQALVEYKAKVNAAVEAGKEKPRITEYIGSCILLISQRLSTAKNFIGYPYREDMISDGYENCLKYIDNYNPEKYNNPHAYFTKIIFWAFVRRIKSEQKESYAKHKIGQKLMIDNNIYGLQPNDQRVIEIQSSQDDRVDEFIRSYEEKMERDKAKTSKKKEEKNEQL